MHYHARLARTCFVHLACFAEQLTMTRNERSHNPDQVFTILRIGSSSDSAISTTTARAYPRTPTSRIAETGLRPSTSERAEI